MWVSWNWSLGLWDEGRGKSLNLNLQGKDFTEKRQKGLSEGGKRGRRWGTAIVKKILSWRLILICMENSSHSLPLFQVIYFAYFTENPWNMSRGRRRESEYETDRMQQGTGRRVEEEEWCAAFGCKWKKKRDEKSFLQNSQKNAHGFSEMASNCVLYGEILLSTFDIPLFASDAGRSPKLKHSLQLELNLTWGQFEFAFGQWKSS